MQQHLERINGNFPRLLSLAMGLSVISENESNPMANPFSNKATPSPSGRLLLPANLPIPPVSKKRIPSVAILVDTSTGWGRRLVRGIHRYAAQHGPWHLWIEPRGRNERLRLPTGWDGEGVIARINSEKIAESLVDQAPNLVNISSIRLDNYKIATVTTDVFGAASLAFEHFYERGLRKFAYVGPLSAGYVLEHMTAFRSIVESKGFSCSTFDFVDDSMASQKWLRRRDAIGAWLHSLPMPIGVFSWGTNAAMQCLDVCRIHDISVPDDVSVLAGDDDELMCNLTTPPLSAVIVASEQIGYAAAEVLDEMMRGVRTAEKRQIPPLIVAARQSTEALAIEDPELLAAVAFIRRNCCSAITVGDVADAVPVGRRTLERKFQDAFGHTPLEEIRRLRLMRVRELLIQTDLPISKIAEKAGFGTPEYMTTIFKAEFGITPFRFRSSSLAR